MNCSLNSRKAGHTVMQEDFIGDIIWLLKGDARSLDCMKPQALNHKGLTAKVDPEPYKACDAEPLV